MQINQSDPVVEEEMNVMAPELEKTTLYFSDILEVTVKTYFS